MNFKAITSIFLLYFFCLSTNAIAESRLLSFSPEKNTNLDGEWNFYPEFLTTNVSNLHSQKIILPNSFENIINQTETKGTFVQHFHLPEHAVGEILAFYVPYQYGAYELYIDDELMIRTGVVGDTETHRTMMAPKLRTFVPQQSTFKMTIKFSSYHHIRGGLENSIFFGYDSQIRSHFYRSILMTTWVSGMLVMISLFMVLFSVYRILQKQNTYKLLFLGLFILFFSLRSFFAVPFSYTLFLPISWLWGTRIEYLLTELLCLSFMTYLHLALPNLLHRYMYTVLSSIILVNIIVTLTQYPIVFQAVFFKSFALSILLFSNMLYGVYRIYKDKSEFSKINTVAILIICITFIHDYLLGLKLIHSVEIAFYTSCLYFIIVTLNLSRDYAIQSQHALRYNQELLHLNQTLDQQVNERTEYIAQLNDQLNLQLKIDALTGAFNRYALNLEIQQRYQQALQSEQSMAFLMIDVDYFKNYNDAYGHLKGDDVLKCIVTTLQKILPKSGFLARYGGEEFAIVVSGMTLDQVSALSMQCLNAIRQQQLLHAYRLDAKNYISISIGAAVMDQNNFYADIATLMKTADQQLYKAKEARDCAIVV